MSDETTTILQQLFFGTDGQLLPKSFSYMAVVELNARR